METYDSQTLPFILEKLSNESNLMATLIIYQALVLRKPF